jgi:tetratricopeptide (TPR) repeat protein
MGLLDSVSSLARGLLKDMLTEAAGRTNLEEARADLRLGDQKAGEALLKSTLERLQLLAHAPVGSGVEVQALKSELDLLRAVAISLIGQGLERRGKADEAERHFAEAARLFARVPDDKLTSRDRSDYGVALSALGRDDQAREQLELARSAEGATPEAWRHLARVLLAGGDPEDLRTAELLLQETLQIVPTDADALELLGRVQQRRGLPLADTTYLKAAYLYLESGRAADARRVLDAARRLGNEQAAPELYAETLRLEGRYEEAAAELDRLLGATPDSPWLLARRGATRFAMGQLEQAAGDLARAIELGANDPPILLLAGRVALAREDLEAVRSYCDRALAADPAQPAVYALRAQAERAHGSAAAALDAVRAGRALSPHDDDLLRLNADLEHAAGNEPMAVELLRRLCGLPDATQQDHLRLVQLLVATGEVEEAERRAAKAAEDWSDDGTVLQLYGELLLRRDKVDQSIRILRRAVRLNRRSADGRLLLGLALARAADRRKGAYDEALVSLDRAAELAPTWAEPHYRRGELLAGRGLPGAAEALERALELDEDHADARLLLARVLIRSRRPGAAEVHLRRLLAHSPGNGTYLLLLALALTEQERYAEAFELLGKPSEEVTGDGGQLTEWLLLRGRVLTSLGRFEEAERHLKQVLDRQPDHPIGWIYRAELARLQGAAGEALAHADRALSFQGDNVQALGIRAAALHDLGRPVEAREAIEQALEHDGSYVFGLLLLSQIVAGSEPRWAQELIQRAIAASPSSRVPRTQKGWLELVLGDPQAALATFDQLLEEGLDAPALSGRAEALSRLGRTEEAVAAAEQALEFRPDDAGALRALGFALFRSGDLARAIAVFRRAYDQYPRDVRAATDLGYALTMDKQVDEALEVLDRACVAAPQNPWPLSRLAGLLLTIGHFEGGARLFRRLLTIVDDDAESWNGLGWVLEHLDPPELEAAKEAFENASRLDPEDPWLRKDVANLLHLTGERAAAAEIYRDLLDQARRPDTEVPDALSLVAWCAFRLGDFKTASRALYEVTSADLEPDSDQLDLALVLFCDGRAGRGVALYERTLTLFSRVPAQLRRGYLRVARDDFRQALRDRPELGGLEAERISHLLDTALEQLPPVPELRSLREPAPA